MLKIILIGLCIGIIFLSGCVKEKPKISLIGTIEVPPNLYVFIDGTYRGLSNPVYHSFSGVIRNCEGTGDLIQLCDKLNNSQDKHPDYDCNVIYEGYFPCIEKNNYIITEDMLEREEIENVKLYCNTCHTDLYKITYVDEIWSENCYAKKQKKLETYELTYLEESFKYADLPEWEFYELIDERIGCICGNTIYESAYCLKDNLTCLVIEENKICNLIKLK